MFSSNMRSFVIPPLVVVGVGVVAAVAVVAVVSGRRRLLSPPPPAIYTWYLVPGIQYIPLCSEILGTFVFNIDVQTVFIFGTEWYVHTRMPCETTPRLCFCYCFCGFFVGCVFFFHL